MSLLERLGDENVWRGFLSDRLCKNRLTTREAVELQNFIDNNQYTACVNNVLNGGDFSLPQKKFVNKSGKAKKRVVYTFKQDENYVLKLLNYLMFQKYDGVFASNCYSFRESVGAKQAVRRLVASSRNKVGYKVDVSDYFNSQNVDFLCEKLQNTLADDSRLVDFLVRLLTQNKAVYKDEIVEESRGAMAGVPVSAFFANLYLTDLDKHFEQQNALYARYSDDVIVFANDGEELARCVCDIRQAFDELKLTVNKSKENYFDVGEWNFLGVKLCGGQVDLSDATLVKIKGKIRRKARSILRWREKKGVEAQKAQRVLVRKFEKKFFSATDELCWSKWFFPLLTVADGLKTVDAYVQQYVRYVASGKFSKSNFAQTSYADIKNLGYHTLVRAFESYRSDRADGLTAQTK